MPKLQNLSLREIKEINCEEMTLVIPFAALEPVGENLPLGVIQMVTEQISGAVSERSDCLVASPITTPYATPMKGFCGVLSLRRNVFMNVIADTVLSACSWGVKRILFLDGTNYSKSSIDLAMKKFKRKLPTDFQYGIINWQSESTLKKVVPQRGTEISNRWRNDAAIELIASEISGIDPVAERSVNTNISDELFDQWLRRGKDPEKLVKYFPNGELSSWGNLQKAEPILPLIVSSINSTIDKGFIFHGI